MMGLLDELGKNNSVAANRHRSKRYFLSHKDEIKQALDKGYTIKEIFNYLSEKKKISISYSTLVNYVSRYIFMYRGITLHDSYKEKINNEIIKKNNDENHSMAANRGKANNSRSDIFKRCLLMR